MSNKIRSFQKAQSGNQAARDATLEISLIVGAGPLHQDKNLVANGLQMLPQGRASCLSVLVILCDHTVDPPSGKLHLVLRLNRIHVGAPAHAPIANLFRLPFTRGCVPSRQLLQTCDRSRIYGNHAVLAVLAVQVRDLCSELWVRN